MSKIHLYRKDAIYGFTDAETECGIIVDNDFIETIDHNAVTCKNCRKTQAFKDLERTNNETREAIEEMNEIKEEQIKKFKDSEPKVPSVNCNICDLRCSNECAYPQLQNNLNSCHAWKSTDSEPNDPAIDLLNEVAELIKISGLSVDEKLQVIDFIESRVRKA
ncbi:MAG: hypothetical protein ACTSSO_07110, partial [Candidatus Hodarchaeales archaeon]